MFERNFSKENLIISDMLLLNENQKFFASIDLLCKNPDINDLP